MEEVLNMKLTDFALILVCFAFTLFVISNLKYSATRENLWYKTLNNVNMDTVVMDVLEKTIEGVDEDLVPIINKEYLAENFFRFLRLSIDSSASTYGEMKLREHVPVLLFAQVDGFYIYVYKTSIRDGEKVYLQEWSEKYIFQTENQVERISLIRDTLEETINDYIKLKNNGIQYLLSFPYLQEEEWYQTIEGTGLYAFYTSGNTRIDGVDYHYFTFSGSTVVRKGY